MGRDSHQLSERARDSDAMFHFGREAFLILDASFLEDCRLEEIGNVEVEGCNFCSVNIPLKA
jgi:hypothetical protein